MNKKMFSVVIGAFLMFFAGIASTQAVTNIALTGTGGSDGTLQELVWATDGNSNLNDGDISTGSTEWGPRGSYISNGQLPARVYITWSDMQVVGQVKVYHVDFGFTYITEKYAVQTLKEGGDPTIDADWITQVNVINPRDDAYAVTTHSFPQTVFTRGVRLYITSPNTVDGDGIYTRILEMQVWGHMRSSLYAIYLLNDLNAQLVSADAQLVAANAQIATLQSQLSIAQADLGTANATILSLQSQLSTEIALAESLQAKLDTANAMIASLTGQLSTANATIASQQDTITTLQNSLNAAYTTIGVLNAEVTRLTAEYDAAIAGLTEIKRLIGTPQGKRASNGIEAGDTTVGALVNDVIDMLLAPPGQNIRNHDWK